jgi:hypothetical protein
MSLVKYDTPVVAQGLTGLRERAEFAKKRGVPVRVEASELLQLLNTVRDREQQLATAKVNVEILTDLDLSDDVREFVSLMAAELVAVEVSL